ncbi:hypothetical protein Fmac_021234 [Flemingia macrophylla]|uniref:S-locus receptor kinase C-terminal domain-containing protein n=1 Tax=Flemingia macrophylla TaxID=520843 RepID=A0ABD1LW91_9FABA
MGPSRPPPAASSATPATAPHPPPPPALGATVPPPRPPPDSFQHRDQDPDPFAVVAALCGEIGKLKSNVFSYGVRVLEILSWKKNREFSNPKHYNSLLGHAWTLWTEDRVLELLDEVLGKQFMPSEVIRCIQVGLLCVQQRPEDRPDMPLLVLMLNGDRLLPKPKVPGFYIEIDVTSEANSSSKNHNLGSINELSITVLDAR